MEAGGVEPPSRDISSKASTYLVTLLHLAASKARQQAKIPPVCKFSSNSYQTLALAYPVVMTSEPSPPGEATVDGPLLLGSHSVVINAV